MSQTVPTGRTAWRHLPLAFLGAFGVIGAANGSLVYFALTSFPGDAGPNAFDVSNRYDQILDRADAQNRLGWEVVQAGARTLALTRAGQPLDGAQLSATASRPLGEPDRRSLTLTPVAPGRFLIMPDLPRGQWDLSLRIVLGGREVRLTRRLLVP